MSEYFRKYIKKQNYPLHYSDVKFKTMFTNCILSALQRRQFKQTNDDDWNIYWCEKEFIPETLERIRPQPGQKVNHFRNYYEICRKDLLVKNLKKHKKQLEKDGKQEEANQYNFYPLTYNLPSEYPMFHQEYKKVKEKQRAVWIMKPIGKSQGKGIFLFKNVADISNWSEMKQQPEPYIVQRYIAEPLLIGGKKFDMRIYALCVSYQPLIIYLNRSGFGRFTHARYDPTDIENIESHLTNVAVQKQSANYDQQRGGKWLLDKLRLFMMSKYGDQKTSQCFYNVQKIIVNTLSSVTRVMMTDKRCFQLYGFDILIDSNLRPWLIEVNGSPSMTANTPIDFQLKCGILDDVFTILDVQKILNGDEEQIGGFDLIYKSKPIKIAMGKNNFSMLGTYNNRHQQIKKLAKATALRLGIKGKEEPTSSINTANNNNRKIYGVNQIISNNKVEVAKQAQQPRVAISMDPAKMSKGSTRQQTQTQVRFPQIKKLEQAKKMVVAVDKIKK